MASVPNESDRDGDTEHRLAVDNADVFRQMKLPGDLHGGQRVAVPSQLATRVHQACIACFARGERTGNAGGLHVVHNGHEHVFWGFDTYDHVQAPLNRLEQRKWTTMLPVHEVEEASWRPLLFGGIDGLEELIVHAKRLADGQVLLACHMLRQGSLQACFSWHQDNRNNPHTKLSMVFLLSPGKSQMRIAGFDSFWYDGPGCGCAFPSAAHHRSGPSSSGTMKSESMAARPNPLQLLRLCL